MKCLREPGVVRRHIAGQILLIPIHAGREAMQNLFVLDEVGDFVWQRMEREETIAELSSAVVEQFEVDVDTAEQDVLDFLRDLTEAGLAKTGA